MIWRPFESLLYSSAIDHQVVDIHLLRNMSTPFNNQRRFPLPTRYDSEINPTPGTSNQANLGDQRRSAGAHVIKRNSHGVIENSTGVRREQENRTHHLPSSLQNRSYENPIPLKKRLDEVQKQLDNQFRQNPHAPTNMSGSGKVKQEYVEQTDDSSGSDSDDDDQDDMDGIMDYFSDIKKHKKELKRLKREKVLLEQNCKNELDQMIVIHKRLASDLDRKHYEEKMAMRNDHARQRQKLTELNKVKLESITAGEKETMQRLKTTRKILNSTIKRKYEDEEDFAPECPLCMEIMTPPKKIYQCSEGHLVCSVCKPKMQNNICATCRNDNGYNSRCRWIEDNIAKRMRNEGTPIV